MLQVTVTAKLWFCVMYTHLMYISQAELEYFVGQDTAGICKAKQGMICEDSLHSRRAVSCVQRGQYHAFKEGSAVHTGCHNRKSGYIRLASELWTQKTVELSSRQIYAWNANDGCAVDASPGGNRCKCWTHGLLYLVSHCAGL